MTTATLRRSLAAVLAALAGLLPLADPAAATPYFTTIDSGTIDFVKTGVAELIDLAPSGPCGNGAMTLDVGTSGLNVTALTWVGIVSTVTGTPASYLVSIFRAGSTPGGFGGGTVTNARVTVRMEVWAVPATGCTPPLTPPLCQLGALLRLDGSYVPGGTATLTAASVGTVAAFPVCSAGPTFLLGTTATTSGSDPLTLS